MTVTPPGAPHAAAGVITAWDPRSGTGIVKSRQLPSGCLFSRTVFCEVDEPRVGQLIWYVTSGTEQDSTILHVHALPPDESNNEQEPSTDQV